MFFHVVSLQYLRLIVEGSLEVELPTIWAVEKQSKEVESEEKDTSARKSEERRYSRAKC